MTSSLEECRPRVPGSAADPGTRTTWPLGITRSQAHALRCARRGLPMERRFGNSAGEAGSRGAYRFGACQRAGSEHLRRIRFWVPHPRRLACRRRCAPTPAPDSSSVPHHPVIARSGALGRGYQLDARECDLRLYGFGWWSWGESNSRPSGGYRARYDHSRVCGLRLPLRRVVRIRGSGRRIFLRCRRSLPAVSGSFPAVHPCFWCQAAAVRPRVPLLVAMILNC